MRAFEHFICPPLQWPTQLPKALASALVPQNKNAMHYTTSTLFENNNAALGGVVIRKASEFPNMQVEFLPTHIRQTWEDMGITFVPRGSLDAHYLEYLLTGVEQLIGVSEPLKETVNNFAYVLHPLNCTEPDTDVSLSDPELPFSVFVSIPNPYELHNVERFAEGLIHEALHLQLTALETKISLVEDSTKDTDVYSPWKGEGRDDRGLLHAVYVFSVLHAFWGKVSICKNSSQRFAGKRQSTIQQQMQDAQHLLSSGSLTCAGRDLAKHHIKCVLSHNN